MSSNLKCVLVFSFGSLMFSFTPQRLIGHLGGLQNSNGCRLQLALRCVFLTWKTMCLWFFGLSYTGRVEEKQWYVRPGLFRYGRELSGQLWTHSTAPGTVQAAPAQDGPGQVFRHSQAGSHAGTIGAKQTKALSKCFLSSVPQCLGQTFIA